MRSTLNGWLVPVFLLLAPGCGGSFPHPPYAAQPTSALTPVPLPPPPARVETVPRSPAKGAVWVDGEWVYRHGRWAWRVGEWVVPSPGTFFSPWTAVRAADGTLYHAPGTWRDEKGDPVTAPPALATATVQAGPVVDAEGVLEDTGRTIKPDTTLPGGSQSTQAAAIGPASQAAQAASP